MEKIHEYCVLVVEVAPKGKLGLQDDSKFVSSNEGSLWRTPGVKPYVVQSVGCTIAQITHPRIDIHSNMTRQRPDTGIVLAS